MTSIQEHMRAVLADPGAGKERKRLAYEFGEMLTLVEAVAERDDAPSATRAKAVDFLAQLAAKEEEHGARFFQEAFLLNIVAEAMMRTDYRAQSIVGFLRSALYFYGIAWIERNQRPRSLDYLSVHADLVMQLTSRGGLKDLTSKAAERFADDRPFCLSNIYLAELKKAYWARRRISQDACDQSISLEEENGTLNAASRSQVDREAVPVTSEDRVQVMLRVFCRDLSEMEQRIYLMRHPIAPERLQEVKPDLAAELAALLDGESEPKSGWREISDRVGVSEKVVKKEYLRALHLLLAGAAREIYGDRLPSGFVRRVLETLRSIVRERDLKIRENAGRGMTKLVERWEIALRFVLNHERWAASAAHDHGDSGFETQSA